MGLGALHAITLIEVQVKATDCRKLLAAVFGSLDAKKEKQVQAQRAALPAVRRGSKWWMIALRLRPD